MYLINDQGEILSDNEVRNRYPNTSFGPNTYSEFGWVPYSFPVHEPSPEEIEAQLINSVTTATQNRLDSFARSRNYDGILSACTYATSPTVKFATEGQYCVVVRDATWSALYTIMVEVKNGVRPMPTGFSDIEADLPVLEWPNETVTTL